MKVRPVALPRESIAALAVGNLVSHAALGWVTARVLLGRQVANGTAVLTTVDALIVTQAFTLFTAYKRPVSTALASLALWQLAILAGGFGAVALQPGLVVALFVAARQTRARLRIAITAWALVSTSVVMATARLMNRPRLGAASWDDSSMIALWFTLLTATIAATVCAGAWAARIDLREQRVIAFARETATEHAHQLSDAVANERRSLARELHDTSSAHLSALIALSVAAEQSLTNELERELLTQIRHEGELLHEDIELLLDSITAPTSFLSLDDVGHEARDHRLAPGSGRIELHCSPELSTISAGLPPVLSHTAFRVIQEALNNVRKHAPGADVEIDIRADAVGLTLRITNTATPRTPATQPDPTRFGLQGMRERVECFGGSLHAGPHVDGWRVEAFLPLHGSSLLAAAPATPGEAT